MKKIAVVTTSLGRFIHASAKLRRENAEFVPIISESDLEWQEFDNLLVNMTIEETKMEQNKVLIKATESRIKKSRK